MTRKRVDNKEQEPIAMGQCAALQEQLSKRTREVDELTSTNKRMRGELEDLTLRQTKCAAKLLVCGTEVDELTSANKRMRGEREGLTLRHTECAAKLLDCGTKTDDVQWKREGAFATGAALWPTLQSLLTTYILGGRNGFGRLAAGVMPLIVQATRGTAFSETMRPILYYPGIGRCATAALRDWGTQERGPYLSGSTQTVVLLSAGDTSLGDRGIMFKIEPVDTQYVWLLAHRVQRFQHGEKQPPPEPIGYLGLDSQNNVGILVSSTPPPGREFQWAFSATTLPKLMDEKQPHIRVSIWNRQQDPAHENWRHPTRVVATRGSMVTTEICEDPTVTAPSEWFVMPDE
jgi:hypothetical protein